MFANYIINCRVRLQNDSASCIIVFVVGFEGVAFSRDSHFVSEVSLWLMKLR